MVWEFIKKQFIDILQWNEERDGVLAWRFPMKDFEIQYGASLTVRESQMAMFVNEGQVADVFGPGMYKLTTQTIPVLTYLKNWDKLFESPFKSDVYFFSTRQQVGRRWGTAQPVTIRDAEFGLVRLRGFGVYSYRVIDPKKLFLEVSGTREQYTVDEMEEQLRSFALSSLAAAFGSSGIAFLDMAANQPLLAQKTQEHLAPVFDKYGLKLESFAVESLSLPEELQKALDARASMNMVGDLNRFVKYQTGVAIPEAARNEGGVAGVGAGMGAGFAMAQQMAGALGAGMGVPAAGVAGAVPSAAGDDPAERLQKLKTLLEQGLITQADFDSAKAEVLKKLVG
jgi:membrane protease subunit (stomatin/prohibitin family)